MLQAKFVEKIKTYILRSITFPVKRDVCEIRWEKYGTDGQSTDKCGRAYVFCTLDN